MLLCGLLSQSFLYSADAGNKQYGAAACAPSATQASYVQMNDVKKAAADKKATAAWQEQVIQHPEYFVGAIFAFESNHDENAQASPVMDFVANAQKKFKKAQGDQSCCNAWMCCPRETITRGRLLEDGTEVWGEETVEDKKTPLTFKGFSRVSSCCGNNSSIFLTEHSDFKTFAARYTAEQLAFIHKLHQQAIENRMKEDATQKVFKDAVMRRDSTDEVEKKKAGVRHIVLNDDELKLYQAFNTTTQLNLAANFDLVESGGKKITGPVLAESRSSMLAGAATLSAAAVVVGNSAVRVSISAASASGAVESAVDGSNTDHIAGVATGVEQRAQSKSNAAVLAVRTGGGSVSHQQQQVLVTDSAPEAAALHDGRNRRSSTMDSEHHGERALEIRRASMVGVPAAQVAN